MIRNLGPLTFILTRLTQKGFNNPDDPDFWVLLLVQKDGSRFFILTHEGICMAQKAGNETFAAKCAQRGKQPDFSKGVDNITVEDVKHKPTRLRSLNLNPEFCASNQEVNRAFVSRAQLSLDITLFFQFTADNSLAKNSK